MAQSKYFHNLKELLKPLTPGIDWAVVQGTNLTVVYYEMYGGAPMSIAPHKHGNEQLSLIVEGELELMIEDETQVLHAGQLAYIGPDQKHFGKPIGQHLKMIDVFRPQRLDHVEKYNGLPVVSPACEEALEIPFDKYPKFIDFLDYDIELKEGMNLAPFNCDTMTAALLQVGIDPGEDEHHHIYEQVNTYLAGEMVMTVNGESCVVGPGWVVTVPPDVPHAGLMTKPALQVNFSSPSRGEGYADFLRGVFK